MFQIDQTVRFASCQSIFLIELYVNVLSIYVRNFLPYTYVLLSPFLHLFKRLPKIKLQLSAYESSFPSTYLYECNISKMCKTSMQLSIQLPMIFAIFPRRFEDYQRLKRKNAFSSILGTDR